MINICFSHEKDMFNIWKMKMKMIIEIDNYYIYRENFTEFFYRNPCYKSKWKRADLPRGGFFVL